MGSSAVAPPPANCCSPPDKGQQTRGAGPDPGIPFLVSVMRRIFIPSNISDKQNSYPFARLHGAIQPPQPLLHWVAVDSEDRWRFCISLENTGDNWETLFCKARLCWEAQVAHWNGNCCRYGKALWSCTPSHSLPWAHDARTPPRVDHKTEVPVVTGWFFPTLKTATYQSGCLIIKTTLI